MNILILGHRGYLGSAMAVELKKRHRVLGWDAEEDLFRLTPELLRGEGVEVLINLAVMSDRASGAYTVDDPTDRVNVEGARHLARILKGTEIGWFQLSTKDVFGPVLGPRDVLKRASGNRPRTLVEDDQPFSPRTFYAKSKLVAEFLSETHPRANVIRLSTCYTDFDHPKGNWVVGLLKKALTGEPVPLTAGGRQFRDPLHVNDLAALIEELAAKGLYGHKLNAGGGRKNVLSLKEIVRLAAPKARLKSLPGGDHGFAFSNRRVYGLASWRPRILLRDRIPALVENLRAGRTAPPL